ncbi:MULTISPECIES: CPBP family intramembrane glutamic endopeptidase [Thermoanaerobacterium]|uniref:Abortive infection protein n=2 Tax=Thermoanaerobacterium TaxID=28895 RepID=W9EDW1_9THEO|nr:MULTISPECIES: CPBP family intramembrane glutamic endopeptidase [Thermoanaerobacterium]AFK86991.1 Abortive infection protein [Thermoanaerobacterium saccharolyticum JW/SL-YS485]ETO39200.1 abortive infection protein [Thermoanaerobacterium aotearoense SCUT27]
MIKKLGILILIFIIFVMALYFYQFMMMYLFEGIYHFFNIRNNDPLVMTSSNLVYNFITEILLLVLAIFILKKFNYTKYIKTSFKSIIKALLFMTLSLIFTKYILDIFKIYNIFLLTDFKNIIASWNKVDYIVAISQMILFILVALSEEYLYRITLYFKISEILNLKSNILKIVFSVILTNILFSIAHYPIRHYNISKLFEIFITGIYFSYLFLRSGNIYLACMMHFYFDFPILTTIDIGYYRYEEIILLMISIMLIESYYMVKRYYLRLYSKYEQS